MRSPRRVVADDRINIANARTIPAAPPAAAGAKGGADGRGQVVLPAFLARRGRPDGDFAAVRRLRLARIFRRASHRPRRNWRGVAGQRRGGGERRASMPPPSFPIPCGSSRPWPRCRRPLAWPDATRSPAAPRSWPATRLTTGAARSSAFATPQNPSTPPRTSTARYRSDDSGRCGGFRSWHGDATTTRYDLNGPRAPRFPCSD